MLCLKGGSFSVALAVMAPALWCWSTTRWNHAQALPGSVSLESGLSSISAHQYGSLYRDRPAIYRPNLRTKGSKVKFSPLPRLTRNW